MLITEIKCLAHRPGQYRISVDNKSVGYISAEDMFSLKIVLNQTISHDVFEQLLTRIKHTSFYSDALRYADRRLRSRLEVELYLLNKGCDPITSQAIINRLVELGIVDEAKLAAALIHDAILSKPLSKVGLTKKLKQKQIANQVIDHQLEALEFTDLNSLDAIIKKKSSYSAYSNNQPRFFRYLLSQGFKYEDIVSRIGQPDLSYGRKRSSHRITLE